MACDDGGSNPPQSDYSRIQVIINVIMIIIIICTPGKVEESGGSVIESNLTFISG